MLKKHKHSDDHNDLNDDNIVDHDDDIRVHKPGRLLGMVNDDNTG